MSRKWSRRSVIAAAPIALAAITCGRTGAAQEQGARRRSRGRYTALAASTNALRTEVQGAQRTSADIGVRLDGLRADLQGLETAMNEVKKRIAALEAPVDRPVCEINLLDMGPGIGVGNPAADRSAFLTAIEKARPRGSDRKWTGGTIIRVPPGTYVLDQPLSIQDAFLVGTPFNPLNSFAHDKPVILYTGKEACLRLEGSSVIRGFQIQYDGPTEPRSTVPREEYRYPAIELTGGHNLVSEVVVQYFWDGISAPAKCWKKTAEGEELGPNKIGSTLIEKCAVKVHNVGVSLSLADHTVRISSTEVGVDPDKNEHWRTEGVGFRLGDLGIQMDQCFVIGANVGYELGETRASMVQCSSDLNRLAGVLVNGKTAIAMLMACYLRGDLKIKGKKALVTCCGTRARHFFGNDTAMLMREGCWDAATEKDLREK